MDKQFTASEVRDEADFGGNLILRHKMLYAYADLLEAQEKAVPVAWRQKHLAPDESQIGWILTETRPAHFYCEPLYTHPAPADAEPPCAASADTAPSTTPTGCDAVADTMTLEQVLLDMADCQGNRGVGHTYSRLTSWRLAIAAAIKQRERYKMDAARMEWYFGPSDKKDWLDTYMRGMRGGWSVGQWRAAIDSAMAKESDNE